MMFIKGGFMLLACEAPLSMMEVLKNYTHYDYALAHHCLNKDYGEEYMNYFIRNKGRSTILDNSAYELGASIDSEVYKGIVSKILPEEIIVPDVRNNMEGTLKLSEAFIKDFKSIRDMYKPKGWEPILIGVAQGRTLEEMMDCTRELIRMGVHKMAFPLFSEAYIILHYNREKEYAHTLGRIDVVNCFYKEFGGFPLHLLGSVLPWEFGLYSPEIKNWIHTIDTSNPIMSAIEDVKWSEGYGLAAKPGIKLDEYFTSDISDRVVNLAIDNINTLKEIIK
jgi:hypothetical protein